MSWRWHSFHRFSLFVAAILSVLAARLSAEEPGTGYVPDLEIEKVIAAAIDPEKAVAFPAQKQLVELGGAADRALNYKLFNEKAIQTRRKYADLIARCCPGRVGYRVTLELQTDGSGRLLLESDRTMLAECAQKFDRLNNKPPVVFPPEELRRNPYSKVDLAKHIVGTMKYNQGSTVDVSGRIVANGEVGFATFDDFAAFATSFDKLGYHMLNGISIFDNNNNLRTLRFKKNPENDRNRSLTYLLMFHDVKWEFVLDYKGEIKSQNATRAANGKYVWLFNCAQMLSGEAEIEASFDPFAVAAAAKPNTPRNDDPAVQNPAPAPVAPGTLAAVAANKVLRVAAARRYDKATMPNPNGPDTIAVLDGSASQVAGPGARFQWVQTSGIPLELAPERLAVPTIKMLFYEAGKYTFELTVSQNGQVSAPAEVAVLVGDVENAQGDQERKPFILPPKKNQDPTPSEPYATKPPDMRYVPIVPKVVSNPAISQPTKEAPSKSGNIELAEIRREEAEYNQRVAALNAAGKDVALNQAKQSATPPDKQEHVIPTTGRIELDEIRREEEEFNRAHPEKRAVKLNSKPVPPEPIKPAAVVEKTAEKPPVVTAPASKPLEPSPVVPVPAVKPPEKTPVVENPANKPPVPAPVKPPVVVTTDKPDVSLDPPTPKPQPEKPVAKVANPEVLPKKTDPEVAVPAPKPEPAQPKISDKELADVKNKLDSLNTKKEDASAQTPPTPPAPAPAPVVPPPPAVVKKDDVKPPVVVKETPAAAPAVPAGNTGPALDRGWLLLKAGQYAAAAEALKPSALANPKDEKTQMALALALFEGAEKPDGYDRAGTQAAMDKFNDVIGLNEENAQAFMYIGHCQARLDHDQEKMMYYKKGFSLGRDKVAWEIKWALGNRYLKAGDFASAVSMLSTAEEAATPAGVKDARLMRDLALAFHGVKKDDEAIKRVNGLWELGYLPDQKLAAELKKASPAAVTVPDSAYAPIAAQTPNIPAAPAIANTNGKANTAASGTPIKPDASAATKPGTDVKPGTPAVASATPGSGKVQQTLEGLDKLNPSIVKPTPRPNPAVTKNETPKEPPKPKTPLPPVPASFDAALAAGKAAVARGEKLLIDNNEETRDHIQECWDEAEAMLRGAWTLNPDNPEVKTQFEKLAEQVGVIALVKSPLLISRPNGLVVLNAEPSIVFPEGKPMYYAWQQVDGTALNIRHEDLDKKKVGLRIKNPGTYKFELVVSDGTRGGNPVTVVVEVR